MPSTRTRRSPVLPQDIQPLFLRATDQRSEPQRDDFGQVERTAFSLELDDGVERKQSPPPAYIYISNAQPLEQSITHIGTENIRKSQTRALANKGHSCT